MVQNGRPMFLCISLPFSLFEPFFEALAKTRSSDFEKDGTTYFIHHRERHRSESERETGYFGSQPFIHVNEVRVKLVFWIKINNVLNIRSCFPRVYPLTRKIIISIHYVV